MNGMEHESHRGARVESSENGSGESSKTVKHRGAAAAFELPSMPVPYEDFQYSLDLPSSLDASDFSLLASPAFADMLPGMSGPSTFSPAPGTSALFSSLGAGSGMTPKPGEEGGRDGSGGDFHLASAADQHRGATSGPLSASESSIFSFDDLTSRAAHHVADGRAGPSSSLFDASESSFLDNFLGGFDSSWDFNPSLPDNMPSFADAQRLAAATSASFANSYEAATVGKYLAGGSSRPRRIRQAVSNSGSTPRGGDAVSETTSPAREGPEATAGAAFGRALDGWANDEMHGDEEQNRDLGRKRSAAHLPYLPQHASQPYIYAPDGSMSGSGASYNLSRGTMRSTYETDSMDVDESAGQMAGAGKKLKKEIPDAQEDAERSDSGTPGGTGADGQAGRKELLTDGEKRQNHILSEQRRRNHIREAFKELVELLEAGRAFGARGLGMSSGAGTGIEDEGLDDRESDDVHSSEDDEVSRAKRRKARNKRAMPGGGRGKGRGRGGSAGGGAGSKSAVLFQTVDLVRWLDGRKVGLEQQCEILEGVAAGADPATLLLAPGPS